MTSRLSTPILSRRPGRSLMPHTSTQNSSRSRLAAGASHDRGPHGSRERDPEGRMVSRPSHERVDIQRQDGGDGDRRRPVHVVAFQMARWAGCASPRDRDRPRGKVRRHGPDVPAPPGRLIQRDDHALRDPDRRRSGARRRIARAAEFRRRQQSQARDLVRSVRPLRHAANTRISPWPAVRPVRRSWDSRAR
jgi:hypothetical protein